jgi:hypothetical protein
LFQKDAAAPAHALLINILLQKMLPMYRTLSDLSMIGNSFTFNRKNKPFSFVPVVYWQE